MAVGKRLYRRPEAGRLGGVCAGIAEYLDVDVALVRIAWILLSIVPGTLVLGFLAYVVAWLIMPEAIDPAPLSARRGLTRSVTDRKIAGVCGGIAEYFELDSTVVRVAVVILAIVPGMVVMGVIGYLVAIVVIPQGERPGAIVATSTV